MTSKEFTIWLKGFLDASTDLTEEGVEFIKSKLKDVQDDYIPSPGDWISPWNTTPINPYIIDYNMMCPMGGYHEYPDIWHSITPPACKKCGYSEPQQVVTWCNTQIVGPMCEVDPNRPCAVNTCCRNNPITNFMPDHKDGDSLIDKPLPSIEPKSCKEHVQEQTTKGQELIVQKALEEEEYVEYEVKPEYRGQLAKMNYVRFKNTPENIEIYRNIIVNPPPFNPSVKTVKDNFREGYLPVQIILDYLQDNGVEDRVVWGLKEYYLFHKRNA